MKHVEDMINSFLGFVKVFSFWELFTDQPSPLRVCSR